jgi:hypothetical protein
MLKRSFDKTSLGYKGKKNREILPSVEEQEASVLEIKIDWLTDLFYQIDSLLSQKYRENAESREYLLNTAPYDGFPYGHWPKGFADDASCAEALNYFVRDYISKKKSLDYIKETYGNSRDLDLDKLERASKILAEFKTIRSDFLEDYQEKENGLYDRRKELVDGWSELIGTLIDNAALTRDHLEEISFTFPGSYKPTIYSQEIPLDTLLLPDGAELI